MKLITDIIKKIGLDKIIHFLLSTLITLLIMKWIGKSGILIILFLSILKEVLDKDFSWDDIIADFLGIISGIGLSYTI